MDLRRVLADMLEGALAVAPLFGGLALHGLSIRFGWGSGLAVPVDGGATLRGRRLFGDNKTYRGILAVAVGTGLGFLSLARHLVRREWAHLGQLPCGGRAFLLGLAVGAAAMLSELPNSALKRQLGITPGAQDDGLRGALFHVLDQVDVLVGSWIVLSFVVHPTAGLLLGSFLFVYLGHQLLTAVGYGLGMRTTWR
jgi:hypothetical protein